MSRRKALLHAQQGLLLSAPRFNPVLKMSLDLWLQAAEDLPQHLQHPHTAAAVHHVQAALRAATKCASDHTQAIEAMAFLPCTCKAMLQCVQTHLAISTRRISIMQTLPAAHKDTTGENQSGYQQAERKAYAWMETQWLVFSLVLPLSAFYRWYGVFASTFRSDAWEGKAPGQQQQTLREGYEQLEQLGCDLRGAAEMCSLLEPAVRELLAKWDMLHLGMRTEDHRSAYYDSAYRAVIYLGKGSEIWLALAVQLPSTHYITRLLPHVINWRALMVMNADCQETQNDSRELVCKLLSQPELLTEVNKAMSPPQVRDMLQDLKIKAEHFQDLGMPAVQAQQLVSKLTGDSASSEQGIITGAISTVRQLAAGECSDINHSTSKSNQPVCDGSIELTADSMSLDATCGEDDDDDDELNDMRALLRQMYGTELVQLGSI